MFNISPAKGFGNVAPNTYARSLGGLPEQQNQFETMLASAGLKGKTMKKIAKAKAKAAKYQGQQAGKAAADAGFKNMLFDIGSGIFSGFAGLGGSGGGGSDAASILSNPNIPDMGYNIDLKFKPPASMNSGYFGGSLF